MLTKINDDLWIDLDEVVSLEFVRLGENTEEIYIIYKNGAKDDVCDGTGNFRKIIEECKKKHTVRRGKSYFDYVE